MGIVDWFLTVFVALVVIIGMGAFLYYAYK